MPRLTSPAGPWTGPVFLLDVGTRAFPVIEVPAFRSALFLPDEIGAFADPMLPLFLPGVRILPLFADVRHHISPKALGDEMVGLAIRQNRVAPPFFGGLPRKQMTYFQVQLASSS